VSVDRYDAAFIMEFIEHLAISPQLSALSYPPEPT
jgi:hypothetical protein